MLVTMGSSPIESVVAAGNIFVGQVSCNLKKTKTKHLLKCILFLESRISNIMILLFFSVRGRVSK